MSSRTSPEARVPSHFGQARNAVSITRNSSAHSDVDRRGTTEK